MCAKKKKRRRFTIETVGGEVLLNMTAMAAKRELCYEFCAFNVVVSTGSRRFSTKNKVQSNTQSCVSSVSVTCMRRTCIVLMRIVVAKKKKKKKKEPSAPEATAPTFSSRGVPGMSKKLAAKLTDKLREFADKGKQARTISCWHRA